MRLGNIFKILFFYWYLLRALWRWIRFTFTYENIFNRDTAIGLLCVVVSLSLLFAASTRLDPINKTREDLKLVSNTALENAPPSLAFATIAMGAFRGLVVDILWIRAENLKEEGQFFDAKQLAEWITTLQPRFAQVWDFQGWNMAYNISVAMPASQWQERWKWVKNGYELIRDKGIKYNPKSIMLYRSLAWIFQHKMGGVTDDCHKHYKRELALEMRSLLGYPMTNQYFDKLEAAPKELKETLQDEKVSEFVNELIKADPIFKDKADLVNNYLTLKQNPAKFQQAAGDVLTAWQDTEAFDKFDTFARAFAVRNNWVMDIDLMIDINKKYGPRSITDPNNYAPINWQLPDAHAIYWAFKGLEVAGNQGVYSIEEKNTDRIVFHSLQSLYRSGQIIIYPITDGPASVFLRPDLAMFDPAAQAWRDAIDKYLALQGSNPKAVMGGYKNFLKNSVALFYQAGHVKKAAIIYKELREKYPLEEFEVSLDTFVQNRLEEEIRDIEIKDATELILMSLREAYFQYGIFNDDQAASSERWAQKVYKIYVKQYSDEEVLRVDLPSFTRLRYIALVGFINDEYYPEHLRQKLLDRIRVERPDLFEQMQKQEHEVFPPAEQEQ